jgi:hypothetical protein
MLLVDPLLIRWPLIEAQAGRCSGFESRPVLDSLGVALSPSHAMDACSRPEPGASCEPPESGS